MRVIFRVWICRDTLGSGKTLRDYDKIIILIHVLTNVIKALVGEILFLNVAAADQWKKQALTVKLWMRMIEQTPLGAESSEEAQLFYCTLCQLHHDYVESALD